MIRFLYLLNYQHVTSIIVTSRTQRRSSIRRTLNAHIDNVPRFRTVSQAASSSSSPSSAPAPSTADLLHDIFRCTAVRHESRVALRRCANYVWRRSCAEFRDRSNAEPPRGEPREPASNQRLFCVLCSLLKPRKRVHHSGSSLDDSVARSRLNDDSNLKTKFAMTIFYILVKYFRFGEEKP